MAASVGVDLPNMALLEVPPCTGWLTSVPGPSKCLIITRPRLSKKIFSASAEKSALQVAPVVAIAGRVGGVHG